jgi:hypothetical protein
LQIYQRSVKHISGDTTLGNKFTFFLCNVDKGKSSKVFCKRCNNTNREQVSFVQTGSVNTAKDVEILPVGTKECF